MRLSRQRPIEAAAVVNFNPTAIAGTIDAFPQIPGINDSSSTKTDFGPARIETTATVLNVARIQSTPQPSSVSAGGSASAFETAAVNLRPIFNLLDPRAAAAALDFAAENSSLADVAPASPPVDLSPAQELPPTIAPAAVDEIHGLADASLFEADVPSIPRHPDAPHAHASRHLNDDALLDMFESKWVET